MKYYKCLNCFFNVTRDDEYCPNCGVLSPLESLSNNEKRFDEKKADETFAYLILGVIFIPLAIYFGVNAGVFGVLCCALPLGIVGLIFIVPIATFINVIIQTILIKVRNKKIEKRDQEIAIRKSAYPESIVFKEKAITERLKHLKLNKQKINSVLEKARLNNDEKWQQVSKTLEESSISLSHQQIKYKLKATEIETLRLQNKVAPFVYDIDQSSFAKIEGSLKAIEQVKKSLNEIVENLNNYHSVTKDSPDHKSLFQRVNDIQNSVNKLYDAFLSRQAVLALQEINLIDAVNPILPPVKAIKESEIFNIQVAITDFSSSFQELEVEYSRLQAEEYVSKKIDNIINKAHEN